MSNETTPIIEVPELRPLLQTFNEELGQYVNTKERRLLGKILTIIDAAIADTDQRKAIKDLVNNAFWGGDGGAVPSDGGMDNPHSDLRAICKLLGFELYPESDNLPGQHSLNENLEWEQKRYRNAVANRK